MRPKRTTAPIVAMSKWPLPAARRDAARRTGRREFPLGVRGKEKMHMDFGRLTKEQTIEALRRSLENLDFCDDVIPILLEVMPKNDLRELAAAIEEHLRN